MNEAITYQKTRSTKIRIIAIALSAILILTVFYGIGPDKAYAANENITLTVPTTTFNITSAQQLLIPFKVTATGNITSSEILLQEYKNGAWAKATDISSSDYISSSSPVGGIYEVSGVFGTRYSASYPYYISGGTHTFRLVVNNTAKQLTSGNITVNVAKITPKLKISKTTVAPYYGKPGKGRISTKFSLTGYSDTKSENYVLEVKSGKNWKKVKGNMYGALKEFDSDYKIGIGKAATYRLRYKGDAFVNGSAVNFSVAKSKITVKVKGPKKFKSGKNYKLKIALSKKSSGMLTVYFKGKNIGSYNFKNKKNVNIPKLYFIGTGKGKIHVKYTPANTKFKNATSKKVSVSVTR